MKTFFKYCANTYYIGDDCESFLFIKNKDGSHYAFFRDQNKDEVVSYNCSKFETVFNNNFGKTPSSNIFSFVYKNDNSDKIKFEMIAEAFTDFLQRIKYPYPIHASFYFAEKYFQDPNTIKNFNFDIMNQTFKYNKEKYCSIPINIYYFILLALKNEMIFQQMKLNFQYVKQNLQNFIKTILYPCSNEVKTLNDEYANKFISKPVMQLEKQFKNLFVVSYFLLTGLKIDLKKDKLNLIDYESSEDSLFLKSALPIDNLDCHNFWIFPASLLVCSPLNLFDIQREYKFTEYQESVLDDILSHWVKKLAPKRSFKSFFTGSDKGVTKETFKAFFVEYEKQYLEDMEEFCIFLKNVMPFLPPNSSKELLNIQNQLKILSKSIASVVSNHSKYAYEDIRTSADNIKKLKRLIHLKTKGDLQKFWLQLDSKELTEKKLTTRELVISYITEKFS